MSNTNIKGTASNALRYTGIVTISQYTGYHKTVLARTHNEGGKALFNYLADCLIGDFDIASVSRPTKIMLLNISADNVISKASNSSFIYILSKPEKVYDEVEGIVRYSFIIPQDILAGTSFNAIGLYTATATEADLADFAACCEVTIDRSTISLSSVLVIDWELHISNR
jgi:hypothetical protein